MKTWFDKNRIKMFNDACNNMLRTEICDGLSIEEMTNALNTLENFNQGDLFETGGVKLADDHDVDIGSEISQAIMAEVVSVEDEKFILQLQNEATTGTTIDFEKTRTENPSHIGERLSCIEDAILDIYKILDTGTRFILCPPVSLALLQSATRSTFGPSKDGVFKGPNNSMLVGYFHLSIFDVQETVPVYSYIPLHTYDANVEDCEYIVGVYYEKEDKCSTHQLVVNNVSFI